MKKIAFVLVSLVALSCASHKASRKPPVTIEDLKKGNELYGVKDNPYFYFMIDSSGAKHLVKAKALNASRVAWIEKLNRR